MKLSHGMVLALVFVVGYALCVFYPNIGAAIKSKVGL